MSLQRDFPSGIIVYGVHSTFPQRRRNNCTSRWQRPVWQLRTIITDIARGTSGETTPRRGIACHLASTNTHHRCHYIVFSAPYSSTTVVQFDDRCREVSFPIQPCVGPPLDSVRPILGRSVPSGGRSILYFHSYD